MINNPALNNSLIKVLMMHKSEKLTVSYDAQIRKVNCVKLALISINLTTSEHNSRFISQQVIL